METPVEQSDRVHLSVYEAYLEGMETLPAFITTFVNISYEAYLEGMETLIFRMSLISSPKYEAYLEGMET